MWESSYALSTLYFSQLASATSIPQCIVGVWGTLEDSAAEGRIQRMGVQKGESEATQSSPEMSAVSVAWVLQ